MNIENIELAGEQAHHFEYLLENAERDDGEEITAEWLAEQLLGQKATEEYFKALQGNQQNSPMQ